MIHEAGAPEVSDGIVGELPRVAYTHMALLLRIGLGVSLALLVGSTLAYVIAQPDQSLSSLLNTNLAAPFLSLTGLFGGLATGSPEAFLTLGVLVLIATPVARVALGAYYFQRNGERIIAAVALIVLILLLVGLLLIGPYIR